MERAVIRFIILGVISGLTKGAGVLPDGPLNATVGGTVMFTTTVTPPETPFTSIGWSFGSKTIVSFTGVNTTGPEYEGRITLFISTGSLELRNLVLSDSGEYRVFLFPPTGPIMQGSIPLKVDANFGVGPKPSGCSSGCIAGTVIACLVVCAAAGITTMYVYKAKCKK